MYFTEAPKPITALKPAMPLVHLGVPTLRAHTQTLTARALEKADKNLVALVSKIPYNAWGGALNPAPTLLIEGLGSASYETIIAVCVELLSQPAAYWNDNRDRDFSGVSYAIEARLTALGYDITEKEERHYMSSGGKRRVSIPNNAKKRGE